MLEFLSVLWDFFFLSSLSLSSFLSFFSLENFCSLCLEECSHGCLFVGRAVRDLRRKMCTAVQRLIDDRSGAIRCWNFLRSFPTMGIIAATHGSGWMLKKSNNSYPAGFVRNLAREKSFSFAERLLALGNFFLFFQAIYLRNNEQRITSNETLQVIVSFKSCIWHEISSIILVCNLYCFFVWRLKCSSLTLNERAHFSRIMTSRSTDF